MTAAPCDFDGGPFHHVEIPVEPDSDGTLPTILVTDEGDYWVTYVLLSGAAAGARPTYSYAGEASPSEIDRERRVPSSREGDGRRA